MFRNAIRIATVTAVAAAAVVFASAPALAAPVYKLPFPCGEVWSGETRTNHSPLNGIDFNRADDEDDWVIASGREPWTSSPDVNVYTGYAAGWIPGVPRC